MTHNALTTQERPQEVWTTKPRKIRTFLREVAIEEEAIRGRIRSAREEAGLTQDQSAELHEVHKRTVENWENKYVPWDRIPDIARNYNVSQEWLLHGDTVRLSEDVEARDDAVLKELGEVRSLLERLAARLDEGGSPSDG